MIYDLRMRRKQYFWIFNGRRDSEKLCIKNKPSLSDYVSLKHRQFIERNFSTYLYSRDPKIFMLYRISVVQWSFIVFEIIMQNPGLTILNLPVPNGGRGVCCARFIFDRYQMIFPSGELLFLFTPMNTKLRVSIYDDIRFPDLHFSSAREIRKLLDRNVTRRERLSTGDRFITGESNFLINEW